MVIKKKHKHPWHEMTETGVSDTAVLTFLKEYAPFAPSKKKLTPTGKILAASAEKLMTELLEQLGKKGNWMR